MDDRMKWYKFTYKRCHGFSRCAVSWKAARSEKEARDYLNKSVRFSPKVVKVETEEFAIG